MNTLIKNACIVTPDGVIPSGALYLAGDKIAYIGADTPPHKFRDKVIDARGGIVMPGLVNCHTHIPMTLLRGYADDLPLHEWLTGHIFPAEDKLDGDAVYWGAQLAYCEMLKSGTTTFADMYFFSDSVVRALDDSGLRGNVARCISGFEEEDFSKSLVEAEALYHAYHGAGDGRVQVDYALHAPYTCGPKAIHAVVKAAEQDEAMVQVHLSETRKENADCQAQYGMSPTQYFEKHGLFSCKVVAAHCVHLSDGDRAILAAHDVGVAHNPTSNLKLASGVAELQKLLDAGIPVGLGTDGTASNNALDLFSEMKLTAILQKGVTEEPTAIPAATALSMATEQGAKILGRSDCGTLAEGQKADIVILDADAPNLLPVHNALSNLVYAVNPGNVKTVLVDGKVLYHNGQFLTMDIEKIKANVASSLARIGL